MPSEFCSDSFLPDFGNADSNQPTNSTLPATPGREPIRHLLFGSPEAIRRTILLLHQLGYAEPSAWSRLQPTQTPGQAMSVLVRYLRIE